MPVLVYFVDKSLFFSHVSALAVVDVVVIVVIVVVFVAIVVPDRVVY